MPRSNAYDSNANRNPIIKGREFANGAISCSAAADADATHADNADATHADNADANVMLHMMILLWTWMLQMQMLMRQMKMSLRHNCACKLLLQLLNPSGRAGGDGDEVGLSGLANAQIAKEKFDLSHRGKAVISRLLTVIYTCLTAKTHPIAYQEFRAYLDSVLATDDYILASPQRWVSSI